MEKIQVKITDIIYDKGEGFQIVKCMPSDSIDKLTLKGNMHLVENKSYILEGSFKIDTKWDDEFFQVVSYSEVQITNEDEVIKYLSSSVFEGIGTRTATKIVAIGKEDTLKLLANNPTYFIEQGINENTIQNITNTLNIKDLYHQLKELTMNIQIGEATFNEIYKYFKTKDIAAEELINNPFQFVNQINYFSFTKADEIYHLKNNDKYFSERITCGIESLIMDACYKDGDSLIPLEYVLNKANNYLDLPSNFDMNKWIIEAIENKVFYNHNGFIQTAKFNKIENEIANNVLRRIDVINLGHPENVIDTKITKLEEKTKINYNVKQKIAIHRGVNEKFSILTGGPGTGKTTIVKAVVSIFEDLNYHPSDIKDISDKIMLCAPTGRAAQRMYESTGYKAKTIHSLLKWDGRDNFFHNFDNPLPQDFFVIDEFSMVDMFLTHSLFRAIKPGAKILIVGDKNQLESVLCGSILHDLLECDKIPRVELDEICRQKEDSSIPELAKIIQENKKISFEKTNDIGYIATNVNIAEQVKVIVDKSIAAGYKASDIQVLYPMKNGRTGINNLNAHLKPKSNNRGVHYGDVFFQEGDRVMQLRNDYDNDIYNGDIGYVKVVNNQNVKGKELAMQVEFPEGDITKPVNLSYNQLEFLTHAYAITIHKSQGSEFPVVIMPVSRESISMVTKKLIYTAVTRAKQKLIIVGDLDCLGEGVKHNDRIRNTNLDNLLNK